MVATFMLTFDCEGKWGVADCLGQRERTLLSDARLDDAYKSILDLLDEFSIPSTFAFVGLFAQSRECFALLRPELDRWAAELPYLRLALDDIDSTNGAGWHGDRWVDAVGATRTSHEIALHGVTHTPWTMLDRRLAEAELSLLDKLEGPVVDSRTFVYPRNLVAHIDLLSSHGFLGFRARPRERSRAASLASEFNLFERPEQPLSGSSITTIPAGYFVNWRHGLRKLVPTRLTVARAARLLRLAAHCDGIVHYWLHPENVASEPSTLLGLRGVVEEVARARDKGACEILTQSDYCISRAARAAVS
jgi:peptidoglycan/xylan/chitin deacetylase (PgdA/CDA1 family)